MGERNIWDGCLCRGESLLHGGLWNGTKTLWTLRVWLVLTLPAQISILNPAFIMILFSVYLLLHEIS